MGAFFYAPLKLSQDKGGKFLELSIDSSRFLKKGKEEKEPSKKNDGSIIENSGF